MDRIFDKDNLLKKLKLTTRPVIEEPKRSICLKNRSEKKSVLVISKNFF